MQEHERRGLWCLNNVFFRMTLTTMWMLCWKKAFVPPKKRRTEEKYGGDSDHPSDGETSVQPMMTKIKTVLKSTWVGQKWWVFQGSGRVVASLAEML